MSRDTTPGNIEIGGSGLTPTAMQNNQTPIPSITQVSRPFFTSREISYLHGQTIDSTLKLQYSTTKSLIFQFLSQAVKLLKFPVRVLATAMNIYQRYYLFNRFDITGHNNNNNNNINVSVNIIAAKPPPPLSPNQFDPFAIAITSLFLASKIEDCVKKLRDIQQVCNKIREIDDTKVVGSSGSSSTSANSSGGTNANGNLTYIDLQRKHILNAEYRLLQITKFDFNYGNNPSFKISVDELMIQFCKKMDINYKVSMLGWSINYDIIQTPLSLMIPPHCIALAIIIVALNLNPKGLALKHYKLSSREGEDEGEGEGVDVDVDEDKEDERTRQILESIDCTELYCPEILVNEAIVYVLDYYTHQYDYSVLTKYLPEIDPETGKAQTFKFMDLKSRFNDVELLNEQSCTRELNSTDEYLQLWDYSVPTKGAARFMLGNKRRRFNHEQRQLERQSKQKQI
ncbi:RNA polymerase II C-terminal domain kinase beta subunit [Lodderomyces elongisporus]|uniref:RNA polymerase II C-terminal domain kinase beta subunit n=1 Tax=Lodderomyces elongisporus TaxID=36914 RepID=UPI00291E60C9|nr:RNA polymerase II C-terminal domain kinase beta subunit [Lodderomyces elongisporus]WLF77944.1 RNA polymerase II C-terminal domain kinase beta subunit [Lodderomyces elongisporus]